MRILLAMFGVLALTACGGIRDDLGEPPEAIGFFRLGHNIAVVNDPVQGPFSRSVENDAWQQAMISAVDARLGEARFFGDKFYHVGVAVEAYVLAMPGVPLVYSPRSVLIFSVNFFEDSTQQRLNDDLIQITVFEPCCSVPLIGTGFTRSAEEQMEGLAFNAARAIERTMRENADWFGGTPEILAEDETIRVGNVLEQNPELVLPAEVVPDVVPVDAVTTNAVAQD